MMDACISNGISFNAEGRGGGGGRGGRCGQGGQGGRGGRGNTPIIYCKCNKPGHKSSLCPDLAETGEMNLMISDDDISFYSNGFTFYLHFSDLKST